MFGSIDVWVANWEIGCCRSIPAPGEPWNAVLVFGGGLTDSPAERLERLSAGDMRIAGPVQERFSGSGEGMAVLRCGPVHVFVPGVAQGQGFEGEGRVDEPNSLVALSGRPDQALCERRGGDLKPIGSIEGFGDNGAGGDVMSVVGVEEPDEYAGVEMDQRHSSRSSSSSRAA